MLDCFLCKCTDYGILWPLELTKRSEKKRRRKTPQPDSIDKEQQTCYRYGTNSLSTIFHHQIDFFGYYRIYWRGCTICLKCYYVPLIRFNSAIKSLCITFDPFPKIKAKSPVSQGLQLIICEVWGEGKGAGGKRRERRHGIYIHLHLVCSHPTNERTFFFSIYYSVYARNLYLHTYISHICREF